MSSHFVRPVELIFRAARTYVRADWSRPRTPLTHSIERWCALAPRGWQLPGSTCALQLEVDSSFDGRDVASLEALMDQFFSGRAKGDRWVPWHTALCEQELFVLTEIYAVPRLSQDEKYILSCAYSGCRWSPMFRDIFMSLFDGEGKLGHEFLYKPDVACRRGGPIHIALDAYRRRGLKIHTATFSPHPPAGAAGDEYTFFILDRTRRFVHLGHDALRALKAEAPTLESIDSVLQVLRPFAVCGAYCPHADPIGIMLRPRHVGLGHAVCCLCRAS